MSVHTLRKMAKQTLGETDVILKRWQEAAARGDFSLRQATPVIDALLDLRTAAALKADPGKSDRAEEKVGKR